jgi:hypothetical protein
MPSTTRQTKLRVVNNNVDLGRGISLPTGEYSGQITETFIVIRGFDKRQVSRVGIYLSEDFLQSIGYPANPNSTREGIEGDFTPSFLKGDIVEI